MKFPSILLYWLLLLIPTLLLGVFGWRILRQEESRLAEAAESAKVERARIVAENLTLFLEEARGGILSGLSEVRSGDAREALEAWTQANPLVLQSFIWRPHAGIILPLSESDEAQSVFLRRYEKLLAPRARWQSKEEQVRPGRSQAGLGEANAAGEGFADSVRPEASPRQQLKQLSDDARLVANSQRHNQTSAAPSADAGFGAEAELSEIPTGALRVESRSRVAADEFPRVAGTGWFPFLDQNPATAIAWVELDPGGEIRGAEVDLEAITSRMTAVLPLPKEGSDVYRLLDHTGNPFPSSTSALPSSNAVSLELGSLLPGWTLLVEAPRSLAAGGRGFFLLSSLLLGVLLTSILSGGSLLLYQAHRHQLDARQKSSFVSNVSHELKTPLTTIRMYAELIGEGRVSDESRKRTYLEVIIAESQRLTRLINNVLDFSRLEQARKSASIQRVDLQGAIASTFDAQEIRLQQAGMSLKRDLPTSPLFVSTDPDALEQALLNLLDNSIKYAAAGGELLVQARKSGDRACIEFLDRGPGIDSKLTKNLFQQFHRGDSSLTAGQPGCGLGLNIAQRLLRQAGGDLAYSSRPGGGACFTITLPVAQP